MTKFGRKDLLPEAEFDPKKAKIRISILIEGDLLESYKEAAKLTSHGQYQTLMKEKLREGLVPRPQHSISEEEFESLKVRLRPAFIEIADSEIREHVNPRALKRS
jgi:hypothetical protein